MTLALLDGRRARVVGWLTTVGLGASFVSVILLSLKVLRGGPVEVVTGGWPSGVGIVLRADVLGVAFAVVCAGVILVSLVYEVSSEVRSRTFPPFSPKRSATRPAKALQPKSSTPLRRTVSLQARRSSAGRVR
jgi:formate hydrogenlyase subunit 3/multisubunit Na+/H+ antiporter MnhD subunit